MSRLRFAMHSEGAELRAQRYATCYLINAIIYVHKSIVKSHRIEGKYFGTGNVEQKKSHRLVWIGNVMYLLNCNYCVPPQQSDIRLVCARHLRCIIHVNDSPLTQSQHCCISWLLSRHFARSISNRFLHTIFHLQFDLIRDTLFRLRWVCCFDVRRFQLAKSLHKKTEKLSSFCTDNVQCVWNAWNQRSDACLDLVDPFQYNATLCLIGFNARHVRTDWFATGKFWTSQFMRLYCNSISMVFYLKWKKLLVIRWEKRNPCKRMSILTNESIARFKNKNNIIDA